MSTPKSRAKVSPAATPAPTATPAPVATTATAATPAPVATTATAAATRTKAPRKRRPKKGKAAGGEMVARDAVLRARRCAPVPKSKFPAVPAEYRPLNRAALRRVLRLLADDLKAEARSALREIDANAATFRDDLGRFAPDPAAASGLLSRLAATEEALLAAESLARYHRDLRDVALSDTVQLLEAAQREHRHAARHEPNLRGRYAALERFFEGRSGAITRGIRRARAGGKVRRADTAGTGRTG